MEEQIDRECRELAKAIFEEFLNDHYNSKVIDILTLEVLLENLNDYI